MPNLKLQSAIEFLSTYMSAILVMAILLVALVYFISLPANALPARCSFAYALTCEGVIVGSTPSGSAVQLELLNAQKYDLVGNTIATVTMNVYGTTNSLCIPGNVLSGGLILCNIQLPTLINANIGQNIAGTILINANVCLQGTVVNCQTSQPVSYIGNFTASLSGRIVAIPYGISISNSIPQGRQATITANVVVFGKPVNGASVFFTQTTVGGGTSQLSPPYSIASANGNVISILTTSSTLDQVTVTATFGSVSASTVSISGFS